MSAELTIATVAATLAAAPADFAADVLLFPLGLTVLPSPAATTTVGSIVVGALDSWPQAATTAALLALAVSVAAAIAAVLLRAPSAGPPEAAAAAAAMLVALIALAPLGRVGYLVYPVDLLAWSLLLGARPSRVVAPAAQEGYAW